MAGLNATEVDTVIELIAHMREEGLSILMVEHVMRAVTSLAERVVVLDLGTKVAEGAPAEVLGDDLVISAYLGGAGPAVEAPERNADPLPAHAHPRGIVFGLAEISRSAWAA